jgi:hypothetical protein
VSEFKTYAPEAWPQCVVDLTQLIVPKILDGDGDDLSILREQFRIASISGVESSGVGYFLQFELPSSVRTTGKEDVAGGSANITLSGLRHGAGCVLFVRGGVLDMFELYSYGEPWPDDARLVQVGQVQGLFEASNVG